MAEHAAVPLATVQPAELNENGLPETTLSVTVPVTLEMLDENAHVPAPPTFTDPKS